MKPVAKNNYYELSYDEANNWIYWTMMGFWESMKVVPSFESDWDKAVSIAKKPFKIFADLTKLKTLVPDVKLANDKMQQKLMQNGCQKVSCLIDEPMTILSMNKVLKDSGMEKIVQYFSSSERQKAKIWLDEK